MNERLNDLLDTLYEEKEELFCLYVGELISADYVDEEELDDHAQALDKVIDFLKTKPETEKRNKYLGIAEKGREILRKDKENRNFS